ncbi:MerR family DNA-binding protein [Halopseudomonas pachastrellae]|nr:MerR family DNA-binding protein [Halopseudomonas pachastrellae]
MRILGLSLAEIPRTTELSGRPSSACTAVNALLDDHISHVRSQITALQALEKQLVSLRASCNDDGKLRRVGFLLELAKETCTSSR